MTESNKQPRWIPAAEKPGGLVPYESVVRHIEWGWEGRFINDKDSGTGRRWLISRHDDNGRVESVSPANLLVRIDPPAQLPESTDAFRREIAELVAVAECARDLNTDPEMVDYYDGMIAAYDAVLNIPTPRRPLMASNTQHDTGLTADTNREIEPGDSVFSWVYEFSILSMRREWLLHPWTVLGFVFVDGDFRPRTDEGVLMHPCFDSRQAAESFGHPVATGA